MQSCVQSSLMIFVILFTYYHLCFNAVSKNHQIIYVNVAVRMVIRLKQKSRIVYFISEVYEVFALGYQFPIFGIATIMI